MDMLLISSLNLGKAMHARIGFSYYNRHVHMGGFPTFAVKLNYKITDFSSKGYGYSRSNLLHNETVTSIHWETEAGL
jgi:hypothetical protein